MKLPKTPCIPKYKSIPTELTAQQFNVFVLAHLSEGRFGPKCKIPLHSIFNYILKLIHTGMQWYQLPIKMNAMGQPEIHYSRVFRIYQRWAHDGSLEKVFENSVFTLHHNNLLDLSILHGDGSSTPAKKGGDRVGYNGYKHFKGEKVIAIVDRNVNVISPYTQAAGNKNESPLFATALKSLKSIIIKMGASIEGSIMSLDGAYDSHKNRKSIFNAQMKPNIPENKRNRKKSKPGKKRNFCAGIFKERFQTIERLFAWEDKFKRLLLRFERKSKNHFGMKLIAFTMINIRHFCQT
jgi:transposase